MDIPNEIAYVKNKEYIYVLTNYDNNNNKIDASIFEIEEWTHLTKLSKLFEDSVFKLNRDPYININQKLKSCVYYLYYSPFCHYAGFNNLQYETLKITDIYEVVFNLVKERKETITINEFRKWVSENYKNIQMYYNDLLLGFS